MREEAGGVGGVCCSSAVLGGCICKGVFSKFLPGGKDVVLTALARLTHGVTVGVVYGKRGRRS